ncbi:hypothetical protein EVAR_67096_1 [Eumeta japonica]|uniref:Uncharacterized protein n=1 Tax=Eumeta variegata TaxID=151549 RepID=A0A4C1ZRE8_EUMVA|nr:hypothetical protein EVAR_67096_1 [Eumeta japonica]
MECNRISTRRHPRQTSGRSLVHIHIDDLTNSRIYNRRGAPIRGRAKNLQIDFAKGYAQIVKRESRRRHLRSSEFVTEFIKTHNISAGLRLRCNETNFVPSL